MAFKVQRVSKAKAPTPTGFTNPEDKILDQKQQSAREDLKKPALPGKPHIVAEPALIIDHNKNKGKNNSVYSYAGVEFRPLHVTAEGGISTAVVPLQKEKTAVGDTYEDVDLPSHDKPIPHNMEQDLVKGSNVNKKPPPLPKPFSLKSKKEPAGSDTTDGPSKKGPPPLPRPYGSRKDDKEGTESKDALVTDAVYAVVNKPPKSQSPQQKEKKPPEDKEPAPPPLPDRPDFETQADFKRSQENLVDQESHQETEKSGKGFGLIKTFKKHMRKASDDNLSNKKITEPKESQESASKDPKIIQAYLVTDIVNQPPSIKMGEPEMYESVSDARDEEVLSPVSNDLPEGWREVEGDGGTYYWHVLSGTTQWNKPVKRESDNASQAVSRPNVEPPKPKAKSEHKKVTSFPVHSMGWVELEESQVAPHNMSDTIAECISILAQKRKDLFATNETWGDGKDLRLLLESDNLKLVDAQTKVILLVQPISKMRVWGAGREEQTDFAYVARDQSTGKHRCQVLRCHAISGRIIHNKLHEMCNKILAEKKKARENQQPASAAANQGSDILNTPAKQSLKDQAGFNVKPVIELKKSFSAKYIGKVNVPRPSGIDILHKAIEFASNAVDPSKWQTCLIDITVSNVRSTDCKSQQVIADDRIKFVSFIGVAKEPRLCGYITTSAHSSPFICHVFYCIPNAASLTRALEEACRLRLQSCLDTNPEFAQKLNPAETEKPSEKDSKGAIGIKGLFGKLGLKKTVSDPSSVPSSENERTFPELPTSSQILIKYYGSRPVSMGTGSTAVKEAVQAVQGTTLQISNMTIDPEGITLDDTIKSGLLRKQIISERISYCALASDRVHFGIIESKGGGKFVCHVFAEYKIPVNTVVESINRICH